MDISEEEFHSYDEWLSLGRYVAKGHKALWINGYAVFHSSQTRKYTKYTGSRDEATWTIY